VKWDAVNKKFRDYIHGHQSRIHNNWGHNPIAIEKSSETRRKQFESGERTVWSKGKTIETNLSLQSAAKKLSARFTPKIKKEYSIRMRTNRLNGTVPTLYGKDSSRWQGGVSSIQQIARASTELYKLWKYPILVRDGFKCTQCSNTAPLHVHHGKETFSDIIKKVMTLEDYEKLEEFNRKKDVSDRVVQYHIKNGVSGITLCEDCHKKIASFHEFIIFIWVSNMLLKSILCESRVPVVVGRIGMAGDIQSAESEKSRRELGISRGKCWRYNPYNKNLYWHGDNSEHDREDEFRVEEHLIKNYNYTVNRNVTLESDEDEYDMTAAFPGHHNRAHGYMG
jgi:hypothetical protein